MGILQANIEVEKAAGGSGFPGVRIVGLVGKNTDCRGGDTLVGIWKESGNVGQGVGESSFDEGVLGG